MRKYHIYVQRTKCLESHFNYIVYRWMPWKYIGYVAGTKELYIFFKLKFRYGMSSIDFYYSFNYFEDEYFKVANSWDFMCACPHEYHRYLIIDDYGNVRDFHQLTDQYKRQQQWHYGTRGGGWTEHYPKLISDQRKSVTPEEIRDIKDEYGITLTPIKRKRITRPWEYSCRKVSGWKMQSKRKRQWRQK